MRRLFAALAAPMVLCACTLLPAPQSEPNHTLVLTARFADRVAQDPGHGAALQVAPLRARPGYDTRGIVYTERANELKVFALNQWAAPPADMLQPLIVDALARTGGIQSVSGPGGSASADLRLDGELVRLHHDFISTPSHVELALRVQLVDVGAGRVLATHEFVETESATSDDAYAGVLAASRALSRVLADLAAFCATQVAQWREPALQ